MFAKGATEASGSKFIDHDKLMYKEYLTQNMLVLVALASPDGLRQYDNISAEELKQFVYTCMVIEMFFIHYKFDYSHPVILVFDPIESLIFDCLFCLSSVQSDPISQSLSAGDAIIHEALIKSAEEAENGLRRCMKSVTDSSFCLKSDGMLAMCIGIIEAVDAVNESIAYLQENTPLVDERKDKVLKKSKITECKDKDRILKKLKITERKDKDKILKKFKITECKDQIFKKFKITECKDQIFKKFKITECKDNILKKFKSTDKDQSSSSWSQRTDADDSSLGDSRHPVSDDKPYHPLQNPDLYYHIRLLFEKIAFAAADANGVKYVDMDQVLYKEFMSEDMIFYVALLSPEGINTLRQGSNDDDQVIISELVWKQRLYETMAKEVSKIQTHLQEQFSSRFVEKLPKE